MSVGSQSQVELSGKSLAKITSATFVVALLALLLFVLPAEFDTDPTGVGEMLGIKGMAGYSVGALSTQPQAYVDDVREFELGPFESVEYKYTLAAGQSMVFGWQAQTFSGQLSEVVFDFHSEEEGTDPEDAVTFDIGRATQRQGNFVAPFGGIHGWYWENRGTELVTVRLQSSGFYSAAKVFSAAGEVAVPFMAAPTEGE
jgi:hypothetical protein